MIDAVGMEEQREQRVSTLSTGQRQRMNFARGLLNDPWIFFLDEPTLGLDVSAARAVRELVLAWKAAVPGRTVLLTTHYMQEADELCDRIAIVDHGRILALGTPDELKRRVQRESVFRLELDRLDGGVGALRRLPGVVSAAQAAGDQADDSFDDRECCHLSPVQDEVAQGDLAHIPPAASVLDDALVDAFVPTAGEDELRCGAEPLSR